MKELRSLVILSGLFILPFIMSCHVAVVQQLVSSKNLTAFSFPASMNSSAGIDSDVKGVISGTTITLTVPYGAVVSSLIAVFTSSGTSVSIGSAVQVSGVTVNNFSGPLTYTVNAADGSSQSYVVKVASAASSSKAITSYSFTSALNSGSGISNDVQGVILGTNIYITVPNGTSINSLVASFSTTGESVNAAGSAQKSGVTANNFSNPVLYKITAADGSGQFYLVTVTVASSYSKSLTAFSFTSALNYGSGIITDITAVISGTNINLNVPYGTSVGSLVATFGTTGVSVTAGNSVQVSGVSTNNFSNPVIYTVHAADGSSLSYVVTLTSSLNSSRAITAFSFTSALNILSGISNDISGAVSGSSITVILPYGASASALVATFSTSGYSVTVGGTNQLSGVTTNNFLGPVTYTVTAADGSSSNYVVNVSIASSSSKDITAFSFSAVLNSGAGVVTDVSGTVSGTNIFVTVPCGSSLNSLVATFSTSGSSVKAGGVLQTSGVSSDDFTSPLMYTVYAADGSSASYLVTVTAALSTAKAMMSYSFLASLNSVYGITNNIAGLISGSNITLSVPFGTIPGSLVATFGSTGSYVTVGGTNQVSGVTANNFSSPVLYTVTAADGSTSNYLVTVTAALNPAKAMTSFSFLASLNSGYGVTNDIAGLISGSNITMTVPFGTSLGSLIATFTSTGASVMVGGTVQNSSVTPNNFAGPVLYTVTAADGSTSNYLVIVSVASSTTTIYSSGWDLSTNAHYWIGTTEYSQANGIHGLSTCVFVTNGIVYTGGCDSSYNACWWSNGVEGPALSKGNGSSAAVNGIYVYNGIVYTAGLDKNGKPCFWSNTNYTQVTSSTANIFAMTIFNGVVYSCGYLGNYACYWSNTTETALQNGGGIAIAKGISVNNGVVYTCGYDSNSNACYWSNGSETVIVSSTAWTSANSIFVYNGVPYTTGYDASLLACEWSNTTEFPVLQNGSGIGNAFGIYVNGGTVYTSGIDAFSNACYWTGQIETAISSGGACLATGIFVY